MLEILGILSIVAFILFMIALFSPNAAFFNKLPVINSKGKSGRRWICFGVWMCINLIGGLIVPSNGTDNPKEKAKAIIQDKDTSSLQNTKKSTKETEPYIVKKTWKTKTSVDEMTDDVNIWKSITSDNRVYFDFPYDGGSTLSIDVRYMKKYGTDVFLTISKGQILCNDFDETNIITVRFDDAPPQKFKCNTPSDMSSNYIFIRDAKRFVKSAKNTKTIKVQLQFFQEGTRTFTFTVDEPLTWDK